MANHIFASFRCTRTTNWSCKRYQCSNSSITRRQQCYGYRLQWSCDELSSWTALDTRSIRPWGQKRIQGYSYLHHWRAQARYDDTCCIMCGSWWGFFSFKCGTPQLKQYFPHSLADILDRALSIVKVGDDTYEIGLHMADVAHFIKPHSPLDKEARARATVVEVVNKTVPMLPAELTSQVTNLVAGKDR